MPATIEDKIEAQIEELRAEVAVLRNTPEGDDVPGVRELFARINALHSILHGGTTA